MKYCFMRDKTSTHLLSAGAAAAIRRHTKESTSLMQQVEQFNEAYSAYAKAEFESDNIGMMPDSAESNIALYQMTCASFLRNPSVILHLFKFKNRERDNLRALDAIKQNFITQEHALIEAIQQSEYAAEFKDFISEINEEIVNDKSCIKFNCFS